MITIKIDTKDVESLFTELGSKLPKVIADTVNVLGGMVKDATINEMKAKFKGGTSNWVLNSFGIKKASQSNPTAEVFYNRGRNFMEIQVDGGNRNRKAAETALQSKGVMPSDTGYIPGPGAALDQYGNLSYGGKMKQILSFFQTYTGTNSRNNRSGATLRSSVSFFALKQQKSGLHPGVFQRVVGQQDMMQAQRYIIAKNLIGVTLKGKSKREALALLKKQKINSKERLPRSISMVMAFDHVKTYMPLIKFYEMGNRIVEDNTASVFRKIAAVEMGGRVQW